MKAGRRVQEFQTVEGQNTTGIGIDAPDVACCGRPDEPHYHRETLDRIERVPVESPGDRIVVTEIHKVTARQLSGVHYRLTCPCGWRYYTDRRNNDARSIALRHEAGYQPVIVLPDKELILRIEGGPAVVPHGTVAEVLEWAGDDESRRRAAWTVERAGKNRKGIIDALRGTTEEQ